MRPVELIVANTIHGVAENIARLPQSLSSTMAESDIMDVVTRDVLGQIAKHARLDVVMKAIAAAGGPSDAGELAARFKAVQDMHKQK